MNSTQTAPAPAPAERTFDMLSLSPGAIEGGAEQIIAKVIPAAVRQSGVSAWSFERGPASAPAIHLLLDVAADELAEVVEVCEDMIASELKDEPRLVLRPLVEIAERRGDHEVGCGVGHRSVTLPDEVGDLGRFWALEQSSSALAQAILAGVREQGWDRKSLAPSLLDDYIVAISGPEGLGPRIYAIMQALLSSDPRSEVLTRQFRENAHRLKSGGDISGAGAFTDELGSLKGAIDAAAAAAKDYDAAEDPAFQAELWRRLASRIGFSQVEAAYIACLASTARAGR